MSKFTPGPWEARKDTEEFDNYSTWKVYSPKGHFWSSNEKKIVWGIDVADVAASEYLEDDIIDLEHDVLYQQEREANARLIAAAPDMYELLHVVMKVCDWMPKTAEPLRVMAGRARELLARIDSTEEKDHDA